MHAGLIVIILLLAWALGPTILKWTGGLFAIVALLLSATGARAATVALLLTGIGGAFMWVVGIAWQEGRDAGRGPLVWRLIADRISALRDRTYRRPLGYAVPWNDTELGAEPSPEYAHALHRDGSGWGRWRVPLRGRGHRRAEPARTFARTDRRHEPNRAADAPPDYDAVGTVIDGVAHDTSPVPGDDQTELERGLRERVDWTLEEAHRYLEPIVYELFVNTGVGWRDRLNAARWQRRSDLPPIYGGEDPFRDRRTLFSVIAYDWTLIGNAFMRDPSAAGRSLCAVANRYAHEGPRENDPAAATRAFGEICAALRPESVTRVLHPTEPWLW